MRLPGNFGRRLLDNSGWQCYNGFKSIRGFWFDPSVIFATLAQLVEQLTRNELLPHPAGEPKSASGFSISR